MELNTNNPLGLVLSMKKASGNQKGLDFALMDKLLQIKPLSDEISDRSKISLSNEEAYVQSYDPKSGRKQDQEAMLKREKEA